MKCHAGCDTSAVLDALGLTVDSLFAREAHPESDDVVARYTYTDGAGAPLFRVNRTGRKRFFQERYSDGRYISGLGDTPRVLYGLPSVLAAAADGATVYVVEGEKDADRMIAEGHTATTAPMGAGKWREGYSEALKGAHAVIVADKDDAGYSHAQHVAASLKDRAASVRVVQAATGKDASDHLSAGLGVEDFVEATPSEFAIAAPDDVAGSTRKRSQADRLVEIARELYDFGVSDTGDTYAVRKSGPPIAVPFRGHTQAVRAELAREHLERYGKVASSTALADAMTTLQGYAQLAEPVRLHLRFASHDAVLWVDLGTPDGAAVRIGPDGWQLCEAGAPVTFYRTELTAPMPLPERGGDVVELREYLNVTDEGWALVLGWLVAAPFPEAPQPIIVLTGQQGTGKSAAARYLAGVIDPSPAPLRTAPRDATEWGTVAKGSAVLALDNLSHVPAWFSDCLCRAVTGDGLVRRKLYSDDDLIVSKFRRALIVTGIDLGTLQADLIDRALFVELQRIPAETRKLDADLEREFAKARGRILGGLFDLVSRAMLHQHRGGAIDGLPRMADYAYILRALDAATGASHLPTYLAASARAMVDASEGNVVLEAILAHMAERDEWSISPSALYDEVTPQDRVPKSWPKTASHLSGLLKRLAPVFRARGIEVEFARTRTGRTVQLSRIDCRDGDAPGDASDGVSRPYLLQERGESAT